MHADSQKLSGVYAMSDEDTMDWDDDTIDWESLFAAVTETNEANSDSAPGYDLRPSHSARVGHIGRSVYLPWGTIVRGQNVSYVPTSHARSAICTHTSRLILHAT